jgi:hypothetical protein
MTQENTLPHRPKSFGKFKRLLAASLLAGLALPLAHAGHLKEADVVALEKQCEAAETPVFERLRKRALAECQDKERSSRGDPASCADRVKEMRPGGPIILEPPLPVCAKAIDARDHFNQNRR